MVKRERMRKIIESVHRPMLSAKGLDEGEFGVEGRRWADVLSTNFSVGVNMYSANVTSYWYRLRSSQRTKLDASTEDMAIRRRDRRGIVTRSEGCCSGLGDAAGLV